MRYSLRLANTSNSCRSLVRELSLQGIPARASAKQSARETRFVALIEPTRSQKSTFRYSTRRTPRDLPNPRAPVSRFPRPRRGRNRNIPHIDSPRERNIVRADRKESRRMQPRRWVRHEDRRDQRARVKDISLKDLLSLLRPVCARKKRRSMWAPMRIFPKTRSASEAL